MSLMQHRSQDYEISDYSFAVRSGELKGKVNRTRKLCQDKPFDADEVAVTPIGINSTIRHRLKPSNYCPQAAVELKPVSRVGC